MLEPLDPLGILLTFEDKGVEERWLSYVNAKSVPLDLIWTVGMIAFGSKIVIFNWAHLEAMPFVKPWTLLGYALYSFVLYLQCRRRDTYIKWRLLGNLGHTFPGKMAIAYTATGILTMYAPLHTQLMFLAVAISTPLCGVPDRCRLLIDKLMSVNNSPRSLNFYTFFNSLGHLWAFNIVNRTSMDMEALPHPMLACMRTHGMSLVIFGAMIPLMVASSIEEHWRLKWHADSGRSLLTPSPLTRAAHDAGLFLLGCAIAREAAALVFFLGF